MIAKQKKELNSPFSFLSVEAIYLKLSRSKCVTLYLTRCATLFCIICGASVNLSFAMLTDMATNTDIIDQVIGPFGALVISVVLLYIVWRYMLKLIKRNDDIQKERIEEYKRKIDELERNTNK